MAIKLDSIGPYSVNFQYHNFSRIHLYNGGELDTSNVQIGSHISREAAKQPRSVPAQVITVDMNKLTLLPENPTVSEIITHTYAYLLHHELKGGECILEEGQSLPEGFLEWYAVPESELNEDEDIPNGDGE